jgi:hypothetical protein
MKISLYSFVLPLLIGLAAFSSKDRVPDYQLAQLFSWSLLIVLGAIFVNNFKYKKLALLLLFTVIIIRILLLTSLAEPIWERISHMLYAIIVICAGACLVLKKPILLLKQMYLLSALSIVISLLQINGVLWAQEFGSGIDSTFPGDEPMLFHGLDVSYDYVMSQSRPDGFTHNNNLTSQLLLFFYAYTFHLTSFGDNFTKPPYRWLFFIAFACALTAGKVIILGILVINAVAWVFLGKKDAGRLFYTLAVTLTAYLLYFILFPGLFISNLNLDWFIYNALGRVINIQSLTGLTIFQPFIDFLAGLLPNSYLGVENQVQFLEHALSDVAISGVAYLIDFLPVFILGTATISIFLLRSLRYQYDLGIPRMRLFLVIMLTALVCSLFGGPFVTSIWFVFFLSFLLIPIIFPYLSKAFCQSVSATQCRIKG